MRCRACATSVDEPDGVPLCPACAAVTGSPREPARSASTSALWLWTSPHAAAALATGDLGVMIRTWRQATGTSQLALAEKLGYDPSYISMIETGRRDVVDIVNRRRIAQHLGIQLHRVGVTDTEAVDHVTMLQFGYSTLRLATIARHAGHGAAAVNELWPLVARLEARADDGIIDKDMLLLLARARAELGVSLGYVLPEERLTFAVRWTGRALRVAEHLDDTDLHAYTLRVHGNELRKAGRVNAALVRLAHAVAIAGADQRAPALVQLARAAQDPATFDATLTELHRTPGTSQPPTIRSSAPQPSEKSTCAGSSPPAAPRKRSPCSVPPRLPPCRHRRNGASSSRSPSPRCCSPPETSPQASPRCTTPSAAANGTGCPTSFSEPPGSPKGTVPPWSKPRRPR